MNLEGITLYSLAEYLKREITGSRIYKIGAPSERTLYFSLKRESDTINLIMDVSGGSPAVWLADKAPDNPPEPSAFCMLLRKHLEEGKITQICQKGLDRILELEISLLGRSSQIVTKQIVLELTGKNANLIFTEDGKIIDSIKHISPLMNSVRVIQPGYPYLPPPEQTGFSILTEDPETIVAAMPDEVNKNIWKTLVSQTTGIGKTTALELFYRANIPLQATYLTPMDRKHLAEAIFFLQTAIKDPTPQFTTLISKSNQCQTIFPFPAAYIPEGCRTETFSSINDAIRYAIQLNPAETPEQELLKHIVAAEIRKAEKKKEVLQNELSKANGAEEQRIIADSLMAALYQIEKSALSCTIPNIYDGTPLQVELSPLLTPAENAQKYYKKYNKLKRAQKEVAMQLSEAEDLLAYLESVEESLNFSSTRLETDEIREELQKAGIVPSSKKKRPSLIKSKPVKIAFSDKTVIFIGRNNRQNDEVTFKIGARNDLWLHTQKIPGSHVLIKSLLPEPEPEALQTAIQLAAWFSKARGGSQIPVDCVLRSNVKKPAGSRPGFVIFTNQKTYYTTPDENYIKTLLQKKGIT